MPRLLLLLPTTTYRTRDFLEAAQKLGIDLTVASEKTSTLERKSPRGLLTLDFRNLSEAVRSALEFSRANPFDAVLGVDDKTAVVAAAIAEALGFPHNTVQAAAAARNKFEMRQRLARGGVRVPPFQSFPLEADPHTAAECVSYPCVLKPLSLAAGRGVIRADNPAEFSRAFERIRALLRGPDADDPATGGDRVLVEDFIPGSEVALEGLMIRGKLHPLALFDKPDPLNGPTFAETIYVTPSRLASALQDEILSVAARAVSALGLAEGPVHAELRINPEGPWVVEVAARSIGGRCSRVLRFGTGQSLEEVILRHALGMETGSLNLERRAAGVMMIPVPRPGIFQKTSGIRAARQIPGVEEVSMTVHAGQRIVPLPEGSPPYMGFIFARGESPEGVEGSLRRAHNALGFVIRPVGPSGRSGRESVDRKENPRPIRTSRRR